MKQKKYLKGTVKICPFQVFRKNFRFYFKKNRLRLVNEGGQGTYILKPIPGAGKNPDQMPANEHLTMQIASQVYSIETANNVLTFFKNGDPAYITRRFDVINDGSKLAQDILSTMLKQSELVKKMVLSSFLDDSMISNYWQSYQGRLKRLMKA